MRFSVGYYVRVTKTWRQLSKTPVHLSGFHQRHEVRYLAFVLVDRLYVVGAQQVHDCFTCGRLAVDRTVAPIALKNRVLKTRYATFIYRQRVHRLRLLSSDTCVTVYGKEHVRTKYVHAWPT